MTAKSTPKPKLFDLPVALAQLDELESYLASVESQLEVVEVDPT